MVIHKLATFHNSNDILYHKYVQVSRYSFLLVEKEAWSNLYILPYSLWQQNIFYSAKHQLSELWAPPTFSPSLPREGSGSGNPSINFCRLRASFLNPKTNHQTAFLRALQSLRVGPCRRPRLPRKRRRRRRRRRLRRRRRITGPSPSSSYRSDQLPPRHHSPSSRVDPSKNRASWMFPPFLGWWIPGGLGFLMLFAPLKPREFEGFVDDLVR